MTQADNYKRTVFNCGEFGSIRVLSDKSAVFFCAKDIATALGFANPRKTVQQVCANRIRAMFITNGGYQSLCFITMEDVLRLLQHGKIIDPGFVRIIHEINDRLADKSDLCDECEGCDEYVSQILNDETMSRISDILDSIDALQNESGICFVIDGVYYEENDGEFIQLL